MGILNFFKSKKYQDSEVDGVFADLLFAETDIKEMFPNEFQNIKSDDVDETIKIYQELTHNPECRIQIAAWNALRNLGFMPDANIGKNILGFVMEVGMKNGCDYLAAYPDFCARYFSYKGPKILWQNENETINNQISELLKEAQKVAYHIGVWNGTRIKEIKNGNARISFLTPSGLMFGEGNFNALGSDPLAHKTIFEATKLKQLLIEYVTKNDK